MGDFYKKEFGGDLLSHQVALAVPSAQRSLTAVIGTGTGVTSAVLYADNKKSGRYQKPELDNSFLSSAFYIKNLDNRTVGGI
jgi:hypothetical protein